MNKISKNQKGFSLVELILVLVVVVLIGAAGYMVYRNHNENKTIDTSTSNAYTGWKTYNSSTFSFKYPSNWQINEGSSGSQPYATLTSKESAIESFIGKDPFYPSNIEDLNLNLFSAQPLYPVGCLSSADKCIVKAVEPLNISGITNSKLVLFSESSVGSTCPSSGEAESCTSFVGDEFEVVSSSTEKVGDQTVPLGITLNGKIYQLVGCIQTGAKNNSISSQECSSINNLSAFEASTNYKYLINVLNSLTIN